MSSAAVRANVALVPERFLSLKEVAQRTSYSTSSVRRLSRKGTMPPILRIGPNRVAMAESAIIRWMEHKCRRE
jgi:predicted DNA-binding transcriptional regulator AlpA